MFIVYLCHVSHYIKYYQGFRNKTKETYCQQMQAIQGNMNDDDIVDGDEMMVAI